MHKRSLGINTIHCAIFFSIGVVNSFTKPAPRVHRVNQMPRQYERSPLCLFSLLFPPFPLILLLCLFFLYPLNDLDLSLMFEATMHSQSSPESTPPHKPNNHRPTSPGAETGKQLSGTLFCLAYSERTNGHTRVTFMMASVLARLQASSSHSASGGVRSSTHRFSSVPRYSDLTIATRAWLGFRQATGLCGSKRRHAVQIDIFQAHS